MLHRKFNQFFSKIGNCQRCINTSFFLFVASGILYIAACLTMTNEYIYYASLLATCALGATFLLHIVVYSVRSALRSTKHDRAIAKVTNQVGLSRRKAIGRFMKIAATAGSAASLNAILSTASYADFYLCGAGSGAAARCFRDQTCCYNSQTNRPYCCPANTTCTGNGYCRGGNSGNSDRAPSGY